MKRGTFDRILASLHDAALSDAHWAKASARIDDALRTGGSGLVFAGGRSRKSLRIFLARFFCHGQRQVELEREYFNVYFPVDERVPRLRHLPVGELVPIRDLYTKRERKSSPTYNEMLVRAGAQHGLNVRLDGPHGSRVAWRISDPIDAGGWSSSQIESIRRLLPHIRQYVTVRRSLAGAGALGRSLDGLLSAAGCGIVQLDWRGRILEANDRAREFLRKGDALLDEGGFLFARSPEDNANLQRLLARAVPPFGTQGIAGSIPVKSSAGLPPVTLHVNPVDGRETELSAWPVAALVVVVGAGNETSINPCDVAARLGLTSAEGQVAAFLAEGKTVREIAAISGRKVTTIRTHIRRIFAKRGIKRQVDLVRLVLRGKV